MSETEHRLGVKEVNLVVRHLKLEGVTGENQQAIIEAVDHTYGIDNVSFDEGSGTLNVAYDATHCELDGIEDILHNHGADVAHDWWTQFKEGYYQYVDDNIRENATRSPWSCHTKPQGNRKPKG